jgi:AraC-like DNA-binding protein
MEVMEERELYLNCDLTLPDLAKASGLSAPQISQVLNGQMNQIFFSFVNNYRIQLARRMLLDPETSGMPIVELAVEVGFKSKSSFYDAFKRATNMTPTQIKRAMEKSPERKDQPA